ncbi:MAG: MBL fold metallo-hydrolase [Acidobacteria bacterium]|nr:MAG: MBL fold metallo-hydrolase [Acidobacteriota bacterium]
MEIAKGVYSMGNWKGGRVRAFLLDDGHELTLVDTLFETDARLILDQIKQIGRRLEDLKRIVLTHCHRSHLGGLLTLKRMTGVPIFAHEWEADLVAGNRRPQTPPFRIIRPFRTLPLLAGLALGLDKHPGCPVDNYLQDGEQVGPLVVVRTPGHTPGHLSFFWPERKLMIAGDIVSTWPRLEPGWKGFMLNLPQHRDSVRRMCGFRPEVLAVGHGDPAMGVHEDSLGQLVEAADKWVRKAPQPQSQPVTARTIGSQPRKRQTAHTD